MKCVAEKISDSLVRNGANPDNKEVYTYSLECLLNSLATFGVILIASALSNKILDAIFWMVFFIPVRSVSGGAHAPNMPMCFVLSVVIGLTCIFSANFIPNYEWIIYSGIAVSIIVVFLFAPVIHKNNPISSKRITRTKKMARIIVVSECAVIIVLNYIWGNQLLYAALLGVVSATFLTLIGYILGKFHKH